MAVLLARFHAAARGFVPPDDTRWNGGFCPGVPPVMVCHNDPVVGNVVFRGDDAAVGLIDFDFAGPNDPMRDLAIAVQHWVPLADPADLIDPPSGWSASFRLAAMCDAYGVDGRAVGRVLDLVDIYLERGRLGVLDRVEAGQEGSSHTGMQDSGTGSSVLRSGCAPIERTCYSAERETLNRTGLG